MSKSLIFKWLSTNNLRKHYDYIQVNEETIVAMIKQHEKKDVLCILMQKGKLQRPYALLLYNYVANMVQSSNPNHVILSSAQTAQDTDISSQASGNEDTKEDTSDESESKEENVDVRLFVVLHDSKIGIAIHCANVDSLASQCKKRMNINEKDDVIICYKPQNSNQLIKLEKEDRLEPGEIYYAKRMIHSIKIVVVHLDEAHCRQSVGRAAREYSIGGGIQRTQGDVIQYDLHLYATNKVQLEHFLNSLETLVTIYTKPIPPITSRMEIREREMFFPFRVHAKANENARHDGKLSNPFVEEAESTKSKPLSYYS